MTTTTSSSAAAPVTTTAGFLAPPLLPALVLRAVAPEEGPVCADFGGIFLGHASLE